MGEAPAARRPDRSVYDYIVVGGGSAGAVVAARLSEDPTARVLLVEAGRRALHPLLAMPLAFPRMIGHPSFSWGYEGEPEPYADGRRLRQPRGKGLGGSSLINGLLWVRGHPRDYQEWRNLGNRGWAPGEIEPLFRRAEATLGVTRGAPDAHFYPRLIASAEKLGLPVVVNDHGEAADGIMAPAYTIHRGRRADTASRYLGPARRRRNLTIATATLVDYVEFEGTRATGIVLDQGQGPERARATREIILCGGAYNSPQLLLRSGVGPADEIMAHGIPVVHDLPGVGRNLQDHPAVSLVWPARPEFSINRDLRLDRMTAALGEWVARGTGPVATLPLKALAFLRTGEGLDRPDAECMIQTDSFASRIWAPGWRGPADPVISIACLLLRPASRGTVRLGAADPRVPPRILTNLLAEPSDRTFFRAIVRTVRELMATEPLAGVVAGPPLPSGELRSDAELDAWVRQTIGTALHPAGSCAMGVGAEAVVDPELRVRGLDGIRVADASVMPRIVGGNINAAVVMIAEKAAELVRAAASGEQSVRAEADRTPQQPAQAQDHGRAGDER